MSMAKITTVRRAQKDQRPCEVCGAALPAGTGYKHYSVGFRGFKRTRCLTCPDPLPSERESSKIASVYAAQEAYDETDVTNLETARTALEDFANAVRDVAQEYRDAADAMGGAGYEMEETADQLDSVADDVEATDLPEPDGDTPTDDELTELRDAVSAAINEAELP